MRLFIYLVILFFLSSCTTIEVTKEVVKVGNVVKEKVEGQFQKEEEEVVEDNTIVKEQQIISEEKEEEKTIVKTQQKLAQINFIGKIEGEEFEGGTANDFLVEIGSKSMIEGFEDGLIGLKKGDKKILELEFPSDYGKSELAGKPVNFETEVNEVLAPKLPDLDTEFFKSAGIEAENVESFKKEVRTKLEEDLVNILNGKVKQSLYDALLEANEFEVPLAMVDSEVSNMKQDTARRMGMDPKDLKEDLFPDDMFKEEATKRVKVGILLNKIIEEKELKPDADKVKEIIEERAKNYKDPQQVINYFYSDDEQLRNIESISLEEQVVDALKLEAKSSDENISYEDCVSGTYG